MFDTQSPAWRAFFERTRRPLTLEALFTDGQIGDKNFELRSAGNLPVSTGQLVCTDAFASMREAFADPPFLREVPVGDYPVTLSIASDPSGRSCPVGMLVVLRDSKPAGFEAAVTGEEDPGASDSPEAFGYYVSSGVTALCDDQAVAACQAFCLDWAQDHPAGDLYTDYFAPLFEAAGGVLNWQIPGSEQSMLLLTSGSGWKHVWWGVDADGQACRLLVLFCDVEQEAPTGVPLPMLAAVEPLSIPSLTLQINHWYERDEHQKIADAINALPPDQLDDELLGQLAVAYNNLGDFSAAVGILRRIKPSPGEAGRWHYRMGYAEYYQSEETADPTKRAQLLVQARESFTRALLNGVPEDIAGDCREFLGYILQDLDDLGVDSGSSEQPMELYAPEQFAVVRTFLKEHIGEIGQVLHDPFPKGVQVDIAVIPPTEEKPFYTLCTVGMGAHLMHLPSDFPSAGLDRAELVLSLPPDWQFGTGEDRWNWPIRLLKDIAHLPLDQSSWLGWGHTIDLGSPVTAGSGLCGCILTGVIHADVGALRCELPGGEIVNFYQVLPLTQGEMNFKRVAGVTALLRKIPHEDFIIRSKREDHCPGFRFPPDGEAPAATVDQVDRHMDSLVTKHLPVDSLMAYAHLAIYLRWMTEQYLLSPAFVALFRDTVEEVRAGRLTDLRPFMRDHLCGALFYALFDGRGQAFTAWYYEYDEQDPNRPYYPADVDDCSRGFFGDARYNSDEFQDEAYLYMPWNEDYYARMKSYLDFRYEEWSGELQDGAVLS